MSCPFSEIPPPCFILIRLLSISWIRTEAERVHTASGSSAHYREVKMCHEPQYFTLLVP